MPPRFRRAEPRAEAIHVLGPAEAPLAVMRGRHRFRLLVHAPRNTDIQAYLRDWLAGAPATRQRPRAGGHRPAEVHVGQRG